MHWLLSILLLRRWHHRLGLKLLLWKLIDLLSHRLSLVLLKGLLLWLHLHVAHGRLLMNVGVCLLLLLLVDSLLLIRVLRCMLVDLVRLQGVHGLLLHVVRLWSLLLSLLLLSQNTSLGYSL